MRFHVVSLPHTQTTLAYSACAYTEKVRKFCVMMKRLGHTVFLYAGDQNEAPCDELITCIPEDERAAAVGSAHYTAASFDHNVGHWVKFNATAAINIRKRMQPGDFLCLIGGWAHKLISELVPELRAVEFGVGYGGTFSCYRVFESAAWMHIVYGKFGYQNVHAIDGNPLDAVIPNYFEKEAFPWSSTQDDYFLFLGRRVERKGINIAAEVCESLGVRFVTAGPEMFSGYGEHLGVVGPEERGKLLSRAKALFAPTLYIEPFGGVAVEAMLCGTPIITTDWGAFTETNVHGVTGFRCRTLEDFKKAACAVGTLDRQRIRHRAQKRYSLEAIAPQYQAYFERLPGG